MSSRNAFMVVGIVALCTGFGPCTHMAHEVSVSLSDAGADAAVLRDAGRDAAADADAMRDMESDAAAFDMNANDAGPACASDADCGIGQECDTTTGACVPPCPHFQWRSGGLCVPGCTEQWECLETAECDLASHTCIDRCGSTELRCEGVCVLCPAASTVACEGAICVAERPCAEDTIPCDRRCEPLPEHALAAECNPSNVVEATSCDDESVLCEGRCWGLPSHSLTAVCSAGSVAATSCAPGFVLCAGSCAAFPEHALTAVCGPGYPVATSCESGFELLSGRCYPPSAAACPALPPRMRSSSPDILDCPCPSGRGPAGELYACDPTVGACAHLAYTPDGFEFRAATEGDENSHVFDPDPRWTGRVIGGYYFNALTFDASGRPIGVVSFDYFDGAFNFTVQAFTVDADGEFIWQTFSKYNPLGGSASVRAPMAHCTDTSITDLHPSGFSLRMNAHADSSGWDEPGSCSPINHFFSANVQVDCFGFLLSPWTEE